MALQLKHFNNMETQELITKIEAICRPFNEAGEAQNAFSVNVLLNDSALAQVPIRQFIELCEHYDRDPSGTKWPTAWVTVGLVSVYIKCEELEAPAKSTALQELRNRLQP